MIKSNENKAMQLLFVGFPKAENEVPEMKKCIDEFVNTVGLAE
ncbi:MULTISPECIES: hypothetical protein [Gammaproteobacteria]|nr:MULTISPECIES: hypothetical protein [Gammaproteobacteria]MDL2138366.1 hypothetical protein [Proteus mirabilis]